MNHSSFTSNEQQATSNEQRTTTFMQNKPNFPNTQMNITSVITKYYENDNAFRLLENKAKQSQFQT